MKNISMTCSKQGRRVRVRHLVRVSDDGYDPAPGLTYIAACGVWVRGNVAAWDPEHPDACSKCRKAGRS